MARTPAKLVKLRIDEVSSVDRGAGEGVRVMLMKRDGVDPDAIDWTAITKALGKTAAADPAADLSKALNEASVALTKSLGSIALDARMDEAAKGAAVAKSMQEFNEHIAELLKAAGQQETDMDAAALQKKLDDDATAHKTALAAEVAKREALEVDLAIAKMSPDLQAYVAKAFPADADKKKAFAAKSKDDQDKECDAAKRASEGDPVVKALTAKNEEMAKRLAALEGDRAVADFAKRATDLGLPAAHGEIMRKAYSGDAAAQVEHDKLLKGLAEQIRTGKVFAEFGKNEDPGKVGGGSAYEQLMQKAVELRKADPKLTEAQAFDKAFIDPANADLVATHKTEEMRKRMVA